MFRMHIARDTEGGVSSKVEFLRIRGQLLIAAPQQSEITRAGVDGHAFRIEAKRASVSQLTTLADVSKNQAGNNPNNRDVRTIEALYRDFVNKLVTIRMDGDSLNVGIHPRDYGEVFVLNVHTVGVVAVANGVGGLMDGGVDPSRYLVGAQWTVQHTDLDYLDFDN